MQGIASFAKLRLCWVLAKGAVAGMRQVLFVAEKNDVAKGVAGILSGGNALRRDGRSKYNKIYSLEMDFMGQRSIISVTSVSGHLMNMQFPPEYKDWNEVTIETLFDAPVQTIIPENMKAIERTLAEESRKADVLVIWTDCDREGENIGDEIRRVCVQSNRNLDVYRAKFSEVTQRAISNAIQNLGRLDSNTVNAVYCRSELDLRIGAAFTRLQTLHLRKKFAAVLTSDGNKVVSYGSCQFPTLGFVVERYKAIENFVAEPFWKIVVEHRRNDVKVEFAWERQRLFEKDIVEIIYDDCMDVGSALIEDVTKKPKTKWRPNPLDTVELEKLACRKLKMGAKHAMTLAEKLYSQGWISYPRTETNKFPADINLGTLVQMQTNHPNWGAFAQEIMDNGGANPRNGNKSDEAHPPIHPLKFANPGQLQGDEGRLYELVVRHFLACVSMDARGQETKVNMRIGGELFVATGLQIEDLGYMKVYPYDKWSDKQLPKYEQGERITDHLLKMNEGSTQPPQLLNEADLIALMDKYGIGTDATHAEHIEKIKERLYVGMNAESRFVPGYLGLALVDGYDNMGFAMSKPQLRADLEKQLEAICSGQRNKNEVLREQLDKYRRIFVEAEVKINHLSSALTRYLNGNTGNPGRLGVQANARTQGGVANPGRGGAAGARGGGATGRGTGTGRPRGRPRGSTNSARAQGEVQIPDHELALLQLPPTTRGRGRGRGSRGGTARGGRGGGDSGGRDGQPHDDGAQVDAPPVCECFEPSVQRTVNKEGANKGRKFFTCAKPLNTPGKCNFFKWVE